MFGGVFIESCVTIIKYLMFSNSNPAKEPSEYLFAWKKASRHFVIASVGEVAFFHSVNIKPSATSPILFYRDKESPSIKSVRSPDALLLTAQINLEL